MTEPRHTAQGRVVKDPPLAPAPTEEKLPDGQHADHWVLSPKERAKGFVRPVRYRYRHVGPPGPQHPTRPLTDAERERYGEGYECFEEYPVGVDGYGRLWSSADLEAVGKGCGKVTKMYGEALAETYARQPDYYGRTFCVGCREYLPVGEAGEFVWVRGGERVGT